MVLKSIEKTRGAPPCGCNVYHLTFFPGIRPCVAFVFLLKTRKNSLWPCEFSGVDSTWDQGTLVAWIDTLKITIQWFLVEMLQGMPTGPRTWMISQVPWRRLALVVAPACKWLTREEVRHQKRLDILKGTTWMESSLLFWHACGHTPRKADVIIHLHAYARMHRSFGFSYAG